MWRINYYNNLYAHARPCQGGPGRGSRRLSAQTARRAQHWASSSAVEEGIEACEHHQNNRNADQLGCAHTDKGIVVRKPSNKGEIQKVDRAFPLTSCSANCRERGTAMAFLSLTRAGAARSSLILRAWPPAEPWRPAAVADSTAVQFRCRPGGARDWAGPDPDPGGRRSAFDACPS
jgi:hypothetical protein